MNAEPLLNRISKYFTEHPLEPGRVAAAKPLSVACPTESTANEADSTTRTAQLAALKRESERALAGQIRRLLTLPMNKRTHFLRIRHPSGGSHLCALFPAARIFRNRAPSLSNCIAFQRLAIVTAIHTSDSQRRAEAISN